MLRGFLRATARCAAPSAPRCPHAPAVCPLPARAPAFRALSSGSSAAGFESTLRAPARSSDAPSARLRASSHQQRASRSFAGVLSVRNSWNNTIVTISDMDYKTKATVSSGSAGFKKGKRSSFFAMEKCVQEAFRKAHAVRAVLHEAPPLVAHAALPGLA